MRGLLTTRGSSGQCRPPLALPPRRPLAPSPRGAGAGAEECRVAAQGRHRANVERARLPFAPLGDLRDEDWMPLLADPAQLDFAAANPRVVGEVFGRLGTLATPPGPRP